MLREIEILMVCPFCKGKKLIKYFFNNKKRTTCVYCAGSGVYTTVLTKVIGVIEDDKKTKRTKKRTKND